MGQRSKRAGSRRKDGVRQGAIKSQAFRHVTGSGSSGAAQAIYCVSDKTATTYDFALFKVHHYQMKVLKSLEYLPTRNKEKFCARRAETRSALLKEVAMKNKVGRRRRRFKTAHVTRQRHTIKTFLFGNACRSGAIKS